MAISPELPIPRSVLRAEASASGAGFSSSCTVAVGHLLASMAATRPAGRIAESGTGHGIGTAWLQSGLGVSASIVAVERNQGRAAVAARLFADDARVQVIHGDWRLLEAYGPFDVFFCDGGGKIDDPEAVVGMLAPGGCSSSTTSRRPSRGHPSVEGAVDELRV